CRARQRQLAREVLMLDSSGRGRWGLVAGVLVLSCRGVLGIEDLSEDLRPSMPAAGAGGGGGSSGLGAAGALDRGSPFDDGGLSGSGGVASNAGSDGADAATPLDAELDAGVGDDLGAPPDAGA